MRLRAALQRQALQVVPCFALQEIAEEADFPQGLQDMSQAQCFERAGAAPEAQT